MVCKDWCDPDRLELDNIQEPEMVSGGTRIAVRAAGLDFVDALMIKGEYQVKLRLLFNPSRKVSGMFWKWLLM